MDSINQISNDSLNLVNYSRQADMMQDLRARPLHCERKPCHIIIGCGGVGFWLGLLLTLFGLEHLIVIDKDKLDSTNIARIPVPTTWIGVNKAVALRQTLRTLRPLALVQVLSTHIDKDNVDILRTLIQKRLSDGSPVCIWDTTDRPVDQETIYEVVKDTGALYRKIGYEGWVVGSYPTYEKMWDTSAEDVQQAGYRTSRANVLSSAVAAALGILALGISAPDTKINLLDVLRKGGYENDQT